MVTLVGRGPLGEITPSSEDELLCRLFDPPRFCLRLLFSGFLPREGSPPSLLVDSLLLVRVRPAVPGSRSRTLATPMGTSLCGDLGLSERARCWLLVGDDVTADSATWLRLTRESSPTPPPVETSSFSKLLADSVSPDEVRESSGAPVGRCGLESSSDVSPLGLLISS